MTRTRVAFLALALAASAAAGFRVPSVWAYAGGPLLVVTDNVPGCAGCHSSVGTDQLRSIPQDRRAAQTVETKHYAAITNGTGAYKELSEADRAKLVEEIKVLDGAAKVAIQAPASVRRGETITVTVRATGGSGPVVGLALLDGDQRYQARPVASDGWTVVGAPKVTGPDGKEQTNWVDRRMEGAKKNLAFVVVFNVQGSAERRQFPESQAVWTLKAPDEPGRYTIGAAFFYGTEKGTTLGAVQQVGGGVAPRGGNLAASGRVQIVRHAITVN
jgi:hypothetical protein